MTANKLGTALITGASAGIGALYADRLAGRGYDLMLVARSADKLESLASSLSGRYGAHVETLQADLTRPSDIKHVEAVLRSDERITMLLNNAGVGATRPLLDTDIDEMDQLIALNVSALTRLTYAAAPAFAARGVGTIINIASAVSIGPEILNGVYGASKAFVLALTQSLQHELAGKGLRIQAVLPGATETNFWNVAKTPVHTLPSEIVMSAEDLVDSALAGLDLGEVVTIPSLPDGAEWDRYEAARQAMLPKLSLAKPAERYKVREREAA